MVQTKDKSTHLFLPCGIELGVQPLPNRHVVCFEIRVLAGTSAEPEEKLGLAHILAQTITKGTQKRSGRELSDAFDAIGASHGGGAGRETTTFTCTVLAEYFEQAVELHAEFLRTPTFPTDSVEVALEIARQEHIALNDDAHQLCQKLIQRQVYGPVLGRHVLGEPESLACLTRDDICEQFKSVYHTGSMQVCVAGGVSPTRVTDVLQKHFEGFGPDKQAGRNAVSFQFQPKTSHHHKDTEQVHIALCFPGVYLTEPDYSTQRVMIGILSGGMSARLFTEVREKQGLVYWVSAWQDMPRGSGMIFLGASTTPERCDRTYSTLLKEVDRLAEDLQQQELDRAIAGIAARVKTQGNTTRAMCSELADDLFHYGRPVPQEEKLTLVRAVTIDGIKAYLKTHPRNQLSVVTLGPKALKEGIKDE